MTITMEENEFAKAVIVDDKDDFPQQPTDNVLPTATAVTESEVPVGETAFEKKIRRRARRRRRMAVGAVTGAVVGGVLLGPIGAVAVGLGAATWARCASKAGEMSKDARTMAGTLSPPGTLSSAGVAVA